MVAGMPSPMFMSMLRVTVHTKSEVKEARDLVGTVFIMS